MYIFTYSLESQKSKKNLNRDLNQLRLAYY